jgi:hypothetical protein
MRFAVMVWVGVSIAVSRRLVAQHPSPAPRESTLESLMGVVRNGYSGSPCLAIRATPLRPGEEVGLIDVPVVGTRGVVEVVAARVDSVTSTDCSHDENRVAESAEDSVYRLTLSRGHLKSGDVYFAVRVPEARIHVSGRTATVVIDRLSRPITLRACTTDEGVHLTAWAGAALSSKRLWHRYVHYESEFFASRCKASDFRDPY